MKEKKIRVLIVDDSALMRKQISEIVNGSLDCEVIATARDGYEALYVTQFLKPDVIILDLVLPKMDGLTCLAYLMSEWPTPVIILSAFTHKDSDAAIKALEYGAIDIVMKPDDTVAHNVGTMKEDLLRKIHIAANVLPANLLIHSLNKIQTSRNKPTSTLHNKVIAIGASTGGPAALTHILSSLPKGINAGILVVQHMPGYFIKAFAERLNQQSELLVKEAEDGEPIVAAKVLVAPADFEMRVVKSQDGSKECIRLEKEKNKLHYLSPSVDKTFCSVASVFGQNVTGLLLTGMGKDGTEGCRKIKEHGGTTFAEHESTCVVYGMPAAAIAAGVIDQVVPLDKIPAVLLTKLGEQHGK